MQAFVNNFSDWVYEGIIFAMELLYVDKPINLSLLQDKAKETYTDLIKGVVDVQRAVIVFGGKMHADCEKELLSKGSAQKDLWGFNYYFGEDLEDYLQYTSLINIRPRQNNLSMQVTDDTLRKSMRAIIDKLVPR